jgi:hypothetical protein
VSDRLRSLAVQHPVVSEGLLAISSHVHNSATLLEALVTTKMPHAAMEDRTVLSGEGLRCHSWKALVTLWRLLVKWQLLREPCPARIHA